MAAEAERRLRTVLKAATALAEPTAVAQKRSAGAKDKETLGTVVGRRIAAFGAQTDGLDRFTSPGEARAVSACGPDTPEAEIKVLAAALALRCIEEVATILRSPSLPSSSTAPPLGSRDSKVLQMLSGIVAKWGVAAQVEQGILPPSLREKQQKDAKLSELSDDDEEGQLARTAERLFAIVAPTTGQGTDMLNPMRALVLPSVFVPLVAALLQLGYGQDSLPWARTSLQSLLET